MLDVPNIQPKVKLGEQKRPSMQIGILYEFMSVPYYQPTFKVTGLTKTLKSPPFATVSEIGNF